jgi:mycofactocin precursor
MADPTVPATTVGPPSATADDEPESIETQPSEEDLVLDELLVEEVSVDGMCGVY